MAINGFQLPGLKFVLQALGGLKGLQRQGMDQRKKGGGGGGRQPFAFDAAKSHADFTISPANTATRTGATGGTYVTALGLYPMAVGDVVAFTFLGGAGSNAPGFGVGNAATVANAEIGNTADSAGSFANGNIEQSGGLVGNSGIVISAPGDVIRVRRVSATAIDWSLNGGAYSAPYVHGIAGALYAGATMASGGGAFSGTLE